MNFQTMSKQRKFVLIAAAVGVVSMFLPWISVSGFGASASVNGMHGSGILVFLCFAAAGAFTLMGDQTKNLDKTFWMITLIAGALAAVIVIWNLIDASSSVYSAHLSFGIYLAALASVGVVVAAFLFRAPTDTIKGGFDSFKKDINDKMNNPNSPNPPGSNQGNNPPV